MYAFPYALFAEFTDIVLFKHGNMLTIAIASIEQSISVSLRGIFDSVSVKQQELDIALVCRSDAKMAKVLSHLLLL